MKPHLVRWHKEYGEKGLVVIDVDDGTEDSMDDLRASVDKSGVKFPVLWDRDAKTVGKYGIKAFPAAYLIGVEGTVLWEGFPLPSVREIENLIEAELEKVKKK